MSAASLPATARGGTPVGHIGDLGPVEAGAVRYLRLWCDGTQTQVSHDFAVALGQVHGDRAAADFDQLCTFCARHGRRPLMRHHLTCKCVGADEACFAAFIANAAEGAREDALLMAMLLVRPDLAPGLTALAQQVGLAIRRMALRTATPLSQEMMRPGLGALH